MIIVTRDQFTQGGPSRTGGRYCGHEGPSSGQRLGVAHSESPVRVAVFHPQHREPIAVRIRTGGGLAHGNLIHPTVPGITQPALNLPRRRAAGKLLSRAIACKQSRNHAVSDRSDSLESLSVLCAVHEQQRSGEFVSWVTEGGSNPTSMRTSV